MIVYMKLRIDAYVNFCGSCHRSDYFNSNYLRMSDRPFIPNIAISRTFVNNRSKTSARYYYEFLRYFSIRTIDFYQQMLSASVWDHVTVAWHKLKLRRQRNAVLMMIVFSLEYSRFLPFGAQGSASVSGGGSGNFLFDIVRVS